MELRNWLDPAHKQHAHGCSQLPTVSVSPVWSGGPHTAMYKVRRVQKGSLQALGFYPRAPSFLVSPRDSGTFFKLRSLDAVVGEPWGP